MDFCNSKDNCMVVLYNPVIRYINVGSYNVDVARSVHVTILTILCGYEVLLLAFQVNCHSLM